MSRPPAQSQEASGRHSRGRAKATTHGELSLIALDLFIERGFDRTTVDDVASAAGIGRRTLFRYFPSKNDLLWGDFDLQLEAMRARLAGTSREVPLIETLRAAVVEFNRFPESERPRHRSRMQMLSRIPSLQAHSTLRYADWRRVIAEHVASRRGEDPDDLTPQTMAWACLGLCLGAYDQWLAGTDLDLPELIDQAFSTAETVFGSFTAEHRVDAEGKAAG